MSTLKAILRNAFQLGSKGSKVDENAKPSRFAGRVASCFETSDRRHTAKVPVPPLL
jgi:hypothetical protein